MTILAKFQADWADEHDVYGFMTYDSRDELEKVFTYMTEYWKEYPNKEVELGFGTNEYLTFENIESFRQCFTIIEISDEEFKTLLRLLPGWGDDVVDFGYTGWADIIDTVTPWKEEDRNERLDKLANELWPIDQPGW